MKLLAKGAGKIITRADSPSLLFQKAFKIALHQFAFSIYFGKIDVPIVRDKQ